MIITLKSSQESSFPENEEFLNAQGHYSHIIHSYGKQYYAEWAGPLSLKSFYNGKAYYDVGNGLYAVDSNNYLILNKQQPYTLTIDSQRDVESFCLFFEAGFAEEVSRSLTTNLNQMLDDPNKPAITPINFVQRLYPHKYLACVLNNLRLFIDQRRYEHEWIREQLHEIMQKLLFVHQDICHHETEQLLAVRAVTRTELYKRLYRAKDFAAASFNQSITLNEMAKVACLSPNHFLRTFKQAFGRTPHQYLTDLRLAQAKHLLEKTDLSIVNICFEVGFESQGSFSWLFRRHEGIPPETYRKQKR